MVFLPFWLRYQLEQPVPHTVPGNFVLEVVRPRSSCFNGGFDPDIALEGDFDGFDRVVELALQHEDDRRVAKGSIGAAQHEEIGKVGERRALVIGHVAHEGVGQLFALGAVNLRTNWIVGYEESGSRDDDVIFVNDVIDGSNAFGFERTLRLR